MMESKEAKEGLGVTDWGLTETTLEEVFLHLAKLGHVGEADEEDHIEGATERL